MKGMFELFKSFKRKKNGFKSDMDRMYADATPTPTPRPVEDVDMEEIEKLMKRGKGAKA